MTLSKAKTLQRDTTAIEQIYDQYENRAYDEFTKYEDCLNDLL